MIIVICEQNGKETHRVIGFKTWLEAQGYVEEREKKALEYHQEEGHRPIYTAKNMKESK